GEPLPDAHQAADRPRGGSRPLLRTRRTARALTEARAGVVAAAADVQARRRPPRLGARHAPPGPALLRVPSRELVHRTRLRAAARAWRRARDRRPSGGQGLSDARAHGRLDVRALPLRVARAARELQRVRTGGVGKALRGLEP